MFNKIYVKTKDIFKKVYKTIALSLIISSLLSLPVPYYIYMGGGISNIDEKVIIDQEKNKEGSFNLAFVKQSSGMVATYLLSYLFPSWEVVSKQDLKEDNCMEKEIIENLDFIQRKMLEETNNMAIELAYRLAEKEIKIKKQQYYILYVLDSDNNPLKSNDILLSYDGIKIIDLLTFNNYIDTKQIGDTINFTVKRKKEIINVKTKVKDMEGEKKIGIGAFLLKEYETNPKILFNFNADEVGSSGGLITTLGIYNKLVTDDITKGLKIVGTGAIDSDGNVLSIDGVRHKVKGAVKNKADVLLVPSGKNYQEAMKIKKQKGYKINIIAVDSVLDAINKLKKL